ncbi:MAG: glycosyltransferase family 2 protein [bacterium]|nr:glycosyltransferase family 2 protein [bacterium]
MWKNKKISVVFPCYNEEENIRHAIREFFATGIVDEVIAVDNNSTDNTKKEILKTKARYFLEKNKGYGWALRRGMKEAKGDLLFTVEPDGTFLAKDIYKFLCYEDEFDVIFGSRTSKSLIWSHANMNWFLRLGNVFVAKLLEYLHSGPCLTDVGCTFKLIKKKIYNKIYRRFKVGDSSFSPEFMMHCLRHALCVEIPVNYRERIGTSKITGDFFKAFKLGLTMIKMIILYRLLPGYFRERKGQAY